MNEEIKKQWGKYFQPLKEKLSARDDIDMALVEKAYFFAADAHKDQKRKTGEPYITHPVAVAELLNDIYADTQTIIAGLLHDTVEDTPIILDDIEKVFGEDVSILVDSITKAENLSVFGNKNEIKMQSLKKIFSGSILNSRAIIIKLADRVHNVQSLHLFRIEKQKRIAEETLDIYYPLTKIFGIWEFKRILENSCFPIIYPERNKEHVNAINLFYQTNKRLVERLKGKLDILFDGISGVSTDVVIDTKSYFPVDKGNVSYCINIVVNTEKIDDIYRVLGRIHQKYSFRKKEFKDYISIPKSNGYKSIHTNIYYFSEIIHFRIQTKAMYERNMKGAFFITPELFPKEDMNISLQALDHNYYKSDQYLLDLKKDILEKRIFVFSEDGNTIFLPKNATGVDFAYAVKEEYGHKLSAIEIYGKKYNPTKNLQNEDNVRLILGEKEDPKVEWIEYAKSSYTKQCIIEWSKKLSNENLFERGILALQKNFLYGKKVKFSLEKIKEVESDLLNIFPEKCYKDIIVKIGSGNIPPSYFSQVYMKILDERKLKSPLYKFFLSVKNFFYRFFYFFFTANIQNKSAFVVLLNIRAKDRKKMLYDILGVIADKNVNISGLKIFSLRPSFDAYYKLWVEVLADNQLQDLVRRLEEIPDMKTIDR